VGLSVAQGLSSKFSLQAAMQDMLSTEDSNGELLSSEWTESKRGA
jgi:hypothetical protein